MKTKKTHCSLNGIVNSLLIIGGILLITATFLFSYLIPKLDSQIAQKARELENFWKNGEMYVNAQESAYMTQLVGGIISLFPTSEQQTKAMNLLEEYWINYKIHQYLLTYDIKDKPTSEEIESMRHLPINQLEKIVKERFDEHVNEYNSTSVKEYDRLNKNKEAIVFWSILSQIIGLVLNQIAIVLQLRLSNK